MLHYSALIAVLAVAVHGQTVINVPATGSVTFQSPNYPGYLYPMNFFGSWSIVGPEGSSLQFDSLFFDLESNSCIHDYVEIIEEKTSFGRFCGADGPAGVRTSGNTATVNFQTDGTVQKYGFKISVRVAKCPAGVGLCPNNEDVCLPNSAWCNGINDCPDGADEDCPDLSQCGKSVIPPLINRRGHKIVGGIEATPNSWPWQIAFLSSSGSQFCGGTIISDQWILTAAHCCAGRTTTNSKIRVGAHQRTTLDAGAVDHQLAKIISHKSYSTRPATNWDFCLLKTQNKIIFNHQVASACLPDAADPLEVAGTQCYITGWGTLSSGGSQPNKLQQTSIQISNQTTCNTAYGGVITPQMICGAEVGRDTCQGDSGGPFVCKDPATDAWKLIGVTSWGRGCAMPGYPGIYSRTSVALDWIVQTIYSG